MIRTKFCLEAIIFLKIISLILLLAQDFLCLLFPLPRDPFSRVSAFLITQIHFTIDMPKSPAVAGLFRQAEAPRFEVPVKI